MATIQKTYTTENKVEITLAWSVLFFSRNNNIFNIIVYVNSISNF